MSVTKGVRAQEQCWNKCHCLNGKKLSTSVILETRKSRLRDLNYYVCTENKFGARQFNATTSIHLSTLEKLQASAFLMNVFPFLTVSVSVGFILNIVRPMPHFLFVQPLPVLRVEDDPSQSNQTGLLPSIHVNSPLVPAEWEGGRTASCRLSFPERTCHQGKTLRDAQIL